jgi:hypothetical protein
VRTAKGGPHVLTRHGRVRHRQQAQALLLPTFAPLDQQGLKNRHYCVASL